MYELGLVTFLDILGFRELVIKSSPEHVAKCLNLLSRFTDDERDEDVPYKPTVISFSDAVVRAHRVESEENKTYPIGLVFLELINLLHAQGELLQYGILLRGGMVLGKIAINSTSIFGPALIEAYDLESKSAQYPRIVVSPNIFQSVDENPLLRHDDHDSETEKSSLKKILCQGDDGLWFIDYLRAIESELDKLSMYKDVLLTHKKIIEESIHADSSISSTTTKYIWMANTITKL
jgi:hypothetical protein